MKAFKISIIGLALILTLALSACSDSKIKDGTYTGKSLPDDVGDIGEVTIVIEDGEIKDCMYVSYDKKGNIKDENYGKDSGNDEFYKKAQIAVDGINSYSKQLIEKKQLELVESVSGATISYNQFNEAVNDALQKATE